MKLYILLLLALFRLNYSYELKTLTEHSEYKSLVESFKNVLIFFNNLKDDDQLYEPNLRILDEIVDAVGGNGAVGFVDCTNKKGMKLCKLLKGVPADEMPYTIRHYKNGEFNKVYDRNFTADTVRRFMKDPDGEVPYADDPDAAVIIHPEKENDFLAILKLVDLPVLAMFYAPWCGHCKRLKPIFNEVARETTDDAILVAADLTIPENKPLIKRYNVPGYPTLIYFYKGKEILFELERTKNNLINFIRNPDYKPEPKAVETFFDNTDVAVLNEDNFEDFIKKNPSVGVMFYAPWCGHCKNVKPEFIKAATELKEQKINGKLAAIDVTLYNNIMSKYEIKGFPTFIYFKNGKNMFKFDHRTKDKLVSFMKNPSEKSTKKSPSPSPPSDDKKWSFDSKNIKKLDSSTFDKEIKKNKYFFVFYYSPTCPHCTNSKPAFTKAAKFFEKSNKNVMFGVIDCSIEKELCRDHKIFSYPQFELFRNGKTGERYSGHRTDQHFIEFIENYINKYESPLPEVKGIEFNMNIAVGTPDSIDNLISMGKHIVLYFSPEDEKQDDFLNEFNQAAQMAAPGVFILFDCNAHKDYCKEQNITKYPIIKYFIDGEFVREDKTGKKEQLLSILANKKYVEPFNFGNNVRIGTYLNFDDLTSGKRSLVFFYAPWCGHCKNIKPLFVEAADKDKKGLYIAIDCTIYASLCKTHEVRSYPTIKMFENGELFSNYYGSRTVNGFIESFNKTKDEMKPPTPTNDFLFHEMVKIATEKNFTETIGDDKAMVMFYAPWCGHCKLAKPEFSAAAILNRNLRFVAVDCTKEKELCKEYSIKGFPTILMFKSGKMVKAYEGPRDSTSFKGAFDELDTEENEEVVQVEVTQKPERVDL